MRVVEDLTEFFEYCARFCEIYVLIRYVFPRAGQRKPGGVICVFCEFLLCKTHANGDYTKRAD